MVRRSYLGECLGFGGVRLVTTHTQHRCIKLLRLDRGRIVGVFGQRTVTRFTIDVRVPAVLFLFEDVAMAALTGLVSGEIHGPSGQVSERIPAKVSILSKTLGDQNAAQDKEEQYAKAKHGGQPEQVPSVFERGIHAQDRNTGAALTGLCGWSLTGSVLGHRSE